MHTERAANLPASGKIDLHSHTTASDGIFAATELVRLAASAGIGTLSITDHDSVASIEEGTAAGEHLNVRIVPGVEFGTDVEGSEVHMLGYFFDPAHPPLLEKLAELREGRLDRGQQMVKKLNAFDVPVTWKRVQEIAAGGSVGRPHVAQAVVEAGHATSISDAFDLYLAQGRPAFVPRTQLSPAECIALVHAAGGAAVLAHPTWVKNLPRLLPSLVKAGLDGIETFYGGYDDATVTHFAQLAARHRLVPTGGSDFHGLPGLAHASLGSVSVPPEHFSELERRALARSRR